MVTLQSWIPGADEADRENAGGVDMWSRADIERVHDVAVLDDVFLALEAHLSRLLAPCRLEGDVVR